MSAPRRVPFVGQHLDLSRDDTMYDIGYAGYPMHAVDYPIRVIVSRPRPDISRWYDGHWCWANCELYDRDGAFLEVRPVLLRCEAIPTR